VRLDTISKDAFENFSALPSGEVLLMFHGDLATFDPRTGRHRVYRIPACKG
jgi:hypothetical protein